jgi:CRISPR-associated protein Cas2
MRNRFIVAYDISNDKRLRQMHRTLLGFGDPLQYSIFRCDLSPTERVLLVAAVTDVMNQRDDRVMIADLGPAKGRAQNVVEWFGRRPGVTERRVVVV